MGEYMFVIADCVACDVTIIINPDCCPSLRVEGVRQPLCRGCFDRWNLIHRTSKGLQPVALHPDAYGSQGDRLKDCYSPLSQG